jgi:hypothetical protein
MKKIISWIRWGREAYLFDSTTYVVKSFVAIFVAYVIARSNPLLQKDIISVLFGVMLTLEPVSITGIRVGRDQVIATVIAAAATALIIFFGGNTALTVALGVAFTLYVSIKISWRFVSPVAYFTAIYMTQYVQQTAAGQPSMLLTFQLRMAALLCGVLIAILFNMVFSQFGYRHMLKKRVLFILEEQKRILETSAESLEAGMQQMPAHFADIEWVYAQIFDREKEYEKLPGWLQPGKAELLEAKTAMKEAKEIAHLIYDIGLVQEAETLSAVGIEQVKAQMKRWGQGLKIEKLSYTVQLPALLEISISNARVNKNLHWIETRYQKLAQ